MLVINTIKKLLHLYVEDTYKERINFIRNQKRLSDFYRFVGNKPLANQYWNIHLNYGAFTHTAFGNPICNN